jgi:hypothetical protein
MKIDTLAFKQLSTWQVSLAPRCPFGIEEGMVSQKCKFLRHRVPCNLTCNSLITDANWHFGFETIEKLTTELGTKRSSGNSRKLLQCMVLKNQLSTHLAIINQSNNCQLSCNSLWFITNPSWHFGCQALEQLTSELDTRMSFWNSRRLHQGMWEMSCPGLASKDNSIIFLWTWHWISCEANSNHIAHNSSTTNNKLPRHKKSLHTQRNTKQHAHTHNNSSTDPSTDPSTG